MAINKNHEFEELNGVKCGIVEKNVTAQRAAFLRSILEHNHYTVVIVPSPPPKVAAPVVPKPGEELIPPPPLPPPPETFTIGVTDYIFNPINAIFGRMLHSPDGHIVTLAYWKQQDAVSHDEVPYYEEK